MKRNLKLPIIISLLVVSILTAYAASLTLWQTKEETSKPGEEKIGVVVILLPQAEFVERVGGNRVKVVVMVPSGANPHIYEPTPSQLKEVSKAKIYFKVGSGVEFEKVWWDKILAVNPNIYVIDGSKGIEIIDKDPHIWTSPTNAKKMVKNFYEGLIKVDPYHKDEYKVNMEKYLEELDKLNSYIQNKLSNFTNKVFLIYHPSLSYLAKEYNLTQISVEYEGKEPSAKVIQKCVEYAKKYNLSYVYVEPQFTSRYAETIAREIGGKIVFLDPLPRSYIDGMKNIINLLSLEFE